MADNALMDQVYHTVMTSFVERGQAPHYTELASAMDVPPELGKALLSDLIGTGVPGWLHPSTDVLASLGPFNNLPTHYRISVRGEQRWFGQ